MDNEKNLTQQTNGTETGATEPATQTKEMSFDDFLAQSDFQAEFDRRMSKGIETAVNKAVLKERDRLNALHSEELSEAEKLAKMNDVEKTEYLSKKTAKELEARERDITRRELTASAKDMLADKHMPIVLADIVNYTDADSVKTSIETIEKTFNDAVAKAVENQLKGSKPPKDAATEGTKTSKEADRDTILKQMRGR